MTSNIKSIARVLICYGETYHGGCPEEVARDWASYGFEPEQVDEWCEIAEVWDAAAAHALAIAGMRPYDVRRVAIRMIDDYGPESYTVGSPTYAVSNGDLRVRDFVEVWRAMQAE